MARRDRRTTRLMPARREMGRRCKRCDFPGLWSWPRRDTATGAASRAGLVDWGAPQPWPGRLAIGTDGWRSDQVNSILWTGPTSVKFNRHFTSDRSLEAHCFDRRSRPCRQHLAEGHGTPPPWALRLRVGSCGRRADSLGSGDASHLVPALCATHADGCRRHSATDRTATDRADADRVGSCRRICSAGVRSAAQQA
jgi:hypothetical protein